MDNDAYNQLSRHAEAIAGSTGIFFGSFKHDVVCLGLHKTAYCYRMLPGRYCSNCEYDFLHPRVCGMFNLIVIGRFIDGAGRSANTGSQCIVVMAKGNRKLNGSNGQCYGDNFIETYFQHRDIKGTGPVIGVFDLQPKYATVEFNTSDVDLQRAKYFVALAALSGSNPNKYITSVVPNGDSGCGMLDEAVQKQMLNLPNK